MLAATLAIIVAFAVPAAAQSTTTATATVAVPTSSATGWRVLQYQDIPAHEVAFLDEGLRIRVRRSASPVVYALPTPIDAGGLRVRGRVDGVLQIPTGLQGEEGFDDYALRAGVVLAGDRRPTLFERLFAPPWLSALFELAPEGRGLSEVRFFNLAADASHVGDRRRHPLHDLLVEEVVAVPDDDGAYVLRASIDSPEQAIALWLSADGDDTGSEFTVLVETIELVLEDEISGAGNP